MEEAGNVKSLGMRVGESERPPEWLRVSLGDPDL